MRRREPTLDPAAEAELQALEAALAGDPAAEPVLAVLVRDVRAEAPTMAPAFRARLDNRVERGFERPLPRRRFALRPMIPALGVAGCVVAGIVAIALTAGGGSNDGSSSSSGGGGGAIATQSGPVAPEAADSAKRSSGSSGQRRQRLRPRPAARRVHVDAPAPRRAQHAPGADHHRRAEGHRRRRARHPGRRGLRAVLAGLHGRRALDRLVRPARPHRQLDDALARLSKLGHVKSLQQSADDITGAYDGASGRLTEARAARRGLLRALGKATTAEQVRACARASPTTAASCSATSASSTPCATGPISPPSASR